MHHISQPLRPVSISASEAEYVTNTALQVLVKAIALKDSQALTDLYDCIAAQVHGAAMSRLNSKEDADEIVCDVFMFVWDNADRYECERGSVLRWLTSIARHRAVSRWHQQQRTIPFDDSSKEHTTTSIGPENDLIQLQNAVATRKALGRLQPLNRTILRLSFFYGLSHQEIAEFLDLPLSTVKSHLRGSLLKMRVLIPR